MRKAVDITINNKELHFPFGIGFLGECLENLGLNVQQIGEKLDNNSFKYVPTLMYESLKYDAYRNDKVLDFTYSDLIDWLDEDENGIKKINLFTIAFVESLTKDVPKQEAPKVEGKSKKKV
jgi:hypothetical protein